MKTRTLAADAAFPDPKVMPNEDDVEEALGRMAFARYAKIQNWLKSECPSATDHWKFSEVSGWHKIPLLRKRRLFYFMPKRGAFGLTFILGDKAVASLEKSPAAKQVGPVLKSAKRYPEGTAIYLDDTTLSPDAVTALIAAKIAH